MSLERYRAYKPIDLEWAGEIPAHWDLIPLKHLASLKSGEQITADRIEETGQYPVYGGNGLRGYCDSFTHEGVLPLIGRQGALCGNINYASGRFWASEHAVVVSPRKRCSVRWLGELLRSMNLGQHSTSAAQPGLSVEAIGNLRVPAPPHTEQFAIGNFLADQNAKADALVAEQERLIGLLKEKRQAVISHVVTKGLDPTVPLKDSGVEWLGRVPKHWNITPIKYLVRSFSQGWSPQCERFPVTSNDEWGILKVGCVNDGRFNSEENKCLPADLEPLPGLEIAQNDVLISRANTRELVGRAAFVEKSYPNLLLCDKLYRLRLDDGVCHPRLLAVYLGSNVARGRIELEATGASQSMVNIAQSAIRELVMPVPPRTEQDCILEVVLAHDGKAEELIEEALVSINLLRERRSALISAAVTGKIDLRGLAPAVQEAA